MTENYDFCVNKEVFNSKLKEMYDQRQGSNNVVWTRKTEQEVINYLNEIKSGIVKKDFHHYYYEKRYELAMYGNKERVILKRNDSSDPLIFKLCFEDFYDKILEAHINTSHGGRDKMGFYVKDKWVISKDAIQLFIKLCSICNDKDKKKLAIQIRKRPVKKVQEKYIEALNSESNFNIFGQVDLIDFQSFRDGEYYLVMCYQEQYTKFIHLRPLKNNHPGAIAEELVKIFCTWGGPHTLQSTHGCEFIASVISELLFLLPKCKVVNGCILEDNERLMSLASEVENMIRTWMIENNSSNWSRGCYEVQWQKNSIFDEALNKTPYQAVFRTPTNYGFRNTTSTLNSVNSMEEVNIIEESIEGSHEEVCSKIRITAVHGEFNSTV